MNNSAATAAALLQFNEADFSAASKDKKALVTTTKDIMAVEKSVHATSAKNGSDGVKDAVKKN